MDTICAWCSPAPVSSRAGGAAGPGAASHGMCRSCLDERLAGIAARPRRRAPLAPSRSYPRARADRTPGPSWLALQGA